MRFSHGLLLTGMTLVSARPIHAHPESAVERAALDALISETPDNVDLYLRRAAHHEDHHDWPAAEADLRRAARLAPGSAAVLIALARVYLGSDRAREARAQLDAVLARHPRAPEALVLRARTRAKQGEIAAAHRDYSKAIAILEEPSPGLFLERASLPISTASALRGLDEGLARLGPASALLERALALELRLGRTDAALARIDLLRANSERQETWLKRRGDVLALVGRDQEARAAYRAAVAAVEALPDWLRNSPETLRLAAELTRLCAPGVS
ncbi:MAG TPA: tetratricopeptide repeat protein [Opitutaceae bacterium]|nr:tetratricopeptide repeat protein [Opitutaceae bacterium]